MIAYLEGVVKFQEQNGIIVLTQGVGYFVHIPKRLLDRFHPGTPVALFLHHHVREDAVELFGFDSRDDLLMFKQLIQVSGVGPRIAVGALSQYTTDQLQQAILHGDVSVLKSISGVGKKTAERIILDLKETIGALPLTTAPSSTRVDPSALEALLSLGYSNQEASQALQHVDSALPLGEQVKAALKQLSTLSYD